MPLLQRFFFVFFSLCAAGLAACGQGDGGSTASSAPVITTQPASASSTGDLPTVFKVVASGGGLSYQWLRNGAAIAGAQAASYSTSQAGSYTVVVSNSMGSVTSSAALLTISADPVITVQPVSASVTTGRSARFSVVATGAGLSYQWFKGGTAIVGATGSSYTASVADSYHVVVGSNRTGAQSVTSATVSLTVSATAIAPAITTQPATQSATAGAPVSFAVTATGTDLSYAWFKDGVAIASATAPTYAIEAAAGVNAGSYYVVVTNSLGFVSSVPARLSILPVGAGSNTAAVVAAAQAFLATLSSTQQSAALSSGSAATVLFPATLENARVWASTPGPRHGLRLSNGNLSVVQLAAADRLISAALSAYGATQVSEIRLSDEAYAQLTTDTLAGSQQYSIAFMGQPSTSSAWTLQLTGHQLTHNITYNGSQVSATPMFIGAQPPNWTVNSAGAYTVNNTLNSNGTPHAALESQRSAVATLAAALQADAAQAATARLGTSITDLVMAPAAASDIAYRSVAYPSGGSGRGLLYASMGAAQQAAVTTVIQAWVKTQAADVAQVLLDAYLSDAALAGTYVAYGVGAGGGADFGEYPNASALPASAANSYLRIDGPRVWIEFLVKADNAANGNAGTVHYRSVWRDKLADYGGQFQ